MTVSRSYPRSSTTAPRLITDSSSSRTCPALATSMCSGRVTTACCPVHSTGKASFPAITAPQISRQRWLRRAKRTARQMAPPCLAGRDRGQWPSQTRAKGAVYQLRRHTNRGPFSDGPVPRSVLARLRRVAYQERASLRVLDRQDATPGAGARPSRGDRLRLVGVLPLPPGRERSPFHAGRWPTSCRQCANCRRRYAQLPELSLGGRYPRTYSPGASRSGGKFSLPIGGGADELASPAPGPVGPVLPP